MKIAVFLFIGIFLSGCSDLESSFTCPDFDNMERASLRIVNKELRVGKVSKWESEASINGTLAAIQHARSWAATITDRCTRLAYNGWLDYFENLARIALVERKTLPAEMDRIGKEIDERNRRADDLAKTLPKPPRS